MLKQFEIAYENDEVGSRGMTAIQYNIHNNLKEFKYISYRRINILVTYTNPKAGIEIAWNDRKSANVKCYIDKEILDDLDNKDKIRNAYKALFLCLSILWKENGWNPSDFTTLYDKIEEEDFFVSIVYRKPDLSPDRKHKAEIICEIFPSYADYYIVFLGKKNTQLQKIKFLVGVPDPSITFLFFNNAYWRNSEYFILTNMHQEIFYIFEVDADTFSIEFSPKYNSLEQCKNYVRAFQADVTSQERLRLLGMAPAK